MVSFGSSSEFFDIMYSDKGTLGPDPWISGLWVDSRGGLCADPNSNGALGAVSWQTTEPRQNVKTINNFMAEWNVTLVCD